MSAAAQGRGIRATAYVILVERNHGKDCTTVGPYRTFSKAETQADEFAKLPGCSCSVEPIYTPEDFKRGLQQ